MSHPWLPNTLNITCNFLYCNHQVHRDFLITLYISISNEDMPCLYTSEVVCCVKSNMEKMKYSEEVHDHCTRQKSDLHTQFCRITLLKNSSANVVIKLYNKLPNTINRLDKIQELKEDCSACYCNTFSIQWMNICTLGFHY